MRRPLAEKLLASMMGLAVPGLGHGIRGRWGIALAFQVLSFGGIITICFSRLIMSDYGLEILGTYLLLVHATSSLSAASVTSAVRRKWKTTIVAIALAMVNIALLLALFFSKANFLGINVYYIPTASMHPTLKPGDLIIVDTWAYNKAKPQTNDIVTFTLPGNPNYVMVKRITGPGSLGESYIMLGDNPHNSEDSRQFGAVPREFISGKVIRTIDILVR